MFAIDPEPSAMHVASHSASGRAVRLHSADSVGRSLTHCMWAACLPVAIAQLACTGVAATSAPLPALCLARQVITVEARLQRGKADGLSRGAYLCVGQAESQVPQGSCGRQQCLQLRVHLLDIQLHLQGAAVCAATCQDFGPRDWHSTQASRRPWSLICTERLLKSALLAAQDLTSAAALPCCSCLCSNLLRHLE